MFNSAFNFNVIYSHTMNGLVQQLIRYRFKNTNIKWSLFSYCQMQKICHICLVLHIWTMISSYILLSWEVLIIFLFHQFSSAAQSCPTLCNPMNCSTPGLLVHYQLLQFTQTHAHQVGDAIQPSHLLSSPSPSAPNPSQHQSLFQWVNTLHEVAKVLEFQL